ncbi:unnamed protein product [Citrullus colocynthis]|uniref:Embryo defective n=1 Tax=Citrullus colocynthis TaxID=252529 RepID=A0ABP0XV36_9ROSI
MATTLISGLSSNLKLPFLSAISSSYFRPGTQNAPFSNSPFKVQSLWLNPTRNSNVLSHNRTGFLISRKLESFTVFAGDSEAQSDGRGEGTMPERFRYLTKEAPDPPVRWPFFVALAFILYAWRAVLFELANWRKAVLSIFGFVGYILKGALALILYVIGDPITSMIRGIETAFYTIRSFYSGIVAYAPIPELTMIIILASTVLAISEASAPDSVSSQPYLLTISGLAGYAAVRGYISEPFFWTILLCVYGFSRFFKKRNDVTSTLPVAAVFAAIGEPWVRILAMGSFLALAIYHHWKKKEDEVEDEKAVYQRDVVPLPLLGVALAIGIHAAAKWAGYRHLTWMIV